METQSKNTKPGWNAEKRLRLRRDWIQYLLHLNDSGGGAIFLDQSEKRNRKPIQSCITFDTQLNIAIK